MASKIIQPFVPSICINIITLALLRKMVGIDFIDMLQIVNIIFDNAFAYLTLCTDIHLEFSFQ